MTDNHYLTKTNQTARRSKFLRKNKTNGEFLLLSKEEESKEMQI